MEVLLKNLVLPFSRSELYGGSTITAWQLSALPPKPLDRRTAISGEMPLRVLVGHLVEPLLDRLQHRVELGLGLLALEVRFQKRLHLLVGEEVELLQAVLQVVQDRRDGAFREQGALVVVLEGSKS